MASVLYNVVLPEIARILFPEMMIRALDYVYTSCTRTHTTVYSCTRTRTRKTHVRFIDFRLYGALKFFPYSPRNAIISFSRGGNSTKSCGYSL